MSSETPTAHHGQRSHEREVNVTQVWKIGQRRAAHGAEAVKVKRFAISATVTRYEIHAHLEPGSTICLVDANGGVVATWRAVSEPVNAVWISPHDDLEAHLHGIEIATSHETVDDPTTASSAIDQLSAVRARSLRINGDATHGPPANRGRNRRPSHRHTEGASTVFQDAVALLTMAMNPFDDEQLSALIAERRHTGDTDELLIAVIDLCRSLCLATSALVRTLDDDLTNEQAAQLAHEELLPVAMQIVRSYAISAARHSETCSNNDSTT